MCTIHLPSCSKFPQLRTQAKRDKFCGMYAHGAKTPLSLYDSHVNGPLGLLTSKWAPTTLATYEFRCVVHSQLILLVFAHILSHCRPCRSDDCSVPPPRAPSADHRRSLCCQCSCLTHSALQCQVANVTLQSVHQSVSWHLFMSCHTAGLAGVSAAARCYQCASRSPSSPPSLPILL